MRCESSSLVPSTVGGGGGGAVEAVPFVGSGGGGGGRRRLDCAEFAVADGAASHCVTEDEDEREGAAVVVATGRDKSLPMIRRAVVGISSRSRGGGRWGVGFKTRERERFWDCTSAADRLSGCFLVKKFAGEFTAFINIFIFFGSWWKKSCGGAGFGVCEIDVAFPTEEQTPLLRVIFFPN